MLPRNSPSTRGGGGYYRGPPGHDGAGVRANDRGGFRNTSAVERSRQRESRELTRRAEQGFTPNNNGGRGNRRDETLKTEKMSPIGQTNTSATSAAPAPGPQNAAGKSAPAASSPGITRVSSASTVTAASETSVAQPQAASAKKAAGDAAAGCSSPVQAAKTATSSRSSAPEADVKKQTPPEKRKFTNRCRLFVGNLPHGLSETGLKDMFLKYGAVAEVYLQAARNFGFVRLDTRANAEKAKEELDGAIMNGREVRIRFAAANCSISVEGLHPLVSNELLEKAFSQFGDVERAVVWCDEKGRSLGKGIIDFARRNSAQNCLKACTDGCFLLTKSPQPVIVKAFENNDDTDGVLDKSLMSHPSFEEQRSVEPHFARPGTFEYTVAAQWKALADAEKAQRDLLERQIREARQQLHTELEQTMLDERAESMRLELQRRQEELERFEEHRRAERAKFADQQRRHESQRRDEYFQQQGNIFRQHGSSSKAVETFLRGRNQMLDEMFHGQATGETGLEGSPMHAGDNKRPVSEEAPPMGHENRPPQMGHENRPPQMGHENRPPQMGHENRPPLGRHHGMPPDQEQPPPGPDAEGGPGQWQNIAAAVSRIQTMMQDDRGNLPPPPHHAFHPDQGRDAPPPQLPLPLPPPPQHGAFPPHGAEPGPGGPMPPRGGGFQPRGPHSHPDHRLPPPMH